LIGGVPDAVDDGGQAEPVVHQDVADEHDVDRVGGAVDPGDPATGLCSVDEEGQERSRAAAEVDDACTLWPCWRR